jgi:hypothetical protein
MNPPALGVLSGLAQIALLTGTHDSKTDQTAQSDQRVGNAGQFGAPSGQKLTSPHQKLTSGPAQQPPSVVATVGALFASARARPSGGAP